MISLEFSMKSLRHTNTLMPFELNVYMSMADISRITHGSFTPDLQRKTFPATICVNKETGATLNLFRTGKIVVGGLNSDFHTLISAELFRYLVNCRLPLNYISIKMSRDDKTNDVYAFETLYKINVYEYYQHNKHNTKVTGKFNNISTKIGKEGEKTTFTLIIFATGCINVIGIRRDHVNINDVVINTLIMLDQYFVK
jgi:TATA-box binding protein (TBP) (component of TFIID and TFIIIB)